MHACQRREGCFGADSAGVRPGCQDDGCGARASSVGPARSAPCSSIHPRLLDHQVAFRGDESSQARTVEAEALDPELIHVSAGAAACPGDRPRHAGSRGRERLAGELLAGRGDQIARVWALGGCPR